MSQEIIKNKVLPRYSVGIDCGIATGIGIFDRITNRLLQVKSTDFYGAMEFLRNFTKNNARIFVEIPGTFMYARNKGQIGAVRDKHLINIGGCRRESELLAEGLRRAGFDVVEVPPVNQTKWTQEEFERQLKTDIKTNAHCRDASRIAYLYAGKRG